MSGENQTRNEMNKMYRWTRYVYDLTRKYYLLGRDHLIEYLDAKPGEHVIEVGCGTARNLVLMANDYQQSFFYGFDASDEMLKTAFKNLQSHKLERKIPLRQAYSQSFDPAQLFDMDKAPDKIVFSYALSIIPPWKESVDHALKVLKSGGEIHIVDFGGQEDLPKFFRKFLFWWLDKFHVYHKPEILSYLQQLAAEHKGRLEYHRLYKGYAWHAIFIKN